MRNLRVEGQNNISISLSWEPPDQPSLQGLTYWAQCSRHGGQTETRNTTDTSVTVDGLDPGSSYECSVWVEKDGVYSTNETLSNTTGESRHYFLTHPLTPLFSNLFPLSPFIYFIYFMCSGALPAHRSGSGCLVLWNWSYSQL